MSVKFRLAQPDDAAGILAIYAPFCESSPVSFEIFAPTEQQMRERIERILPHYPWLIGEIDGDVAGYVYASQHRERAAYRWAVDVAVYIAEHHRRRSLGRALYSSLFAILRRQGYFKAIAGITLPNPASVRLHEAVGFRPVAVYPGIGYKFGQWLDVGWWQLDLQPEQAKPTEPQAFREIRDHGAIAAALADGAGLVRPNSAE
ncbi:MAG: arsinothricin resistance N-acetyltransferase ArsN1 family B [Pirellulales bacterium]